METPLQRHIIGEGRFLRLVKVGRWEVAERTKANGVVVIVPRLDDGRWLIIEQTRFPIGGVSIEFPAGLSGDSDDVATEPLEQAAARELMEETGYLASSVRTIGRSAPSPGLTSEIMTFFYASGLEQKSDGGGIGEENIKTHLIPDAEIDAWLQIQSTRATVSAMVYSGLYLARTLIKEKV